MKHLIALFLTLLLLASQASAQPTPPTCSPITTAKGFTAAAFTIGKMAAYWCPDAWGDWTMVTQAARSDYTLKHPTWGATPAAIVEAYWRENVTVNCAAPGDGDLALLCAEARHAALQTRPLPPYIVRVNGTSATRPTYPVVAGVRSKTSNGSVPIRDARGRPVACNAAQSVKEGSSTYMQVKRTANTVALCGAS